MYNQLLKCSYTLYVALYLTENYKQWLHNGILWLFIDHPPFWPYDASFPALFLASVHLNSTLTSSTYPMMFPCLSLSSILYVAPWDAADGHGNTLMPYYMCRWGWILGKMGNDRACMMLRCHGWGYKPPLIASHIHIGCIQSVWTPWDAVDGHALHTQYLG